MRTPIIAGNWKLNKGPAAAAALARGVRERVAGRQGVDVVLAPPFVSLPAVQAVLVGSDLGLAAQNLHWEDSGAFTGEISAPMLREVGCDFVIIGHSERRQHFGETDETVNFKVNAALAHGLVPIVCIGETLEEREDGRTNDRVEIQLRGGLTGLTGDQMRRVVLAYEPIWAIGTGRTATDEQAQEVHGFIRRVLTQRFDDDVAEAVRVQYGGSVKPDNVAGLMAMPDIDGALVGGASLTVESFCALVEAGSHRP
jgi:triosephosphate isomerase (TIM)